MEKRLGPLNSLTITLFGGYRPDDHDMVLHLHAANLLIGLGELVSPKWDFNVRIDEI